MVPFTSITIVPTNNKLFALEAKAKAGAPQAGGLGETQELVTKWSLMHVVRSLFPVAAAVLRGRVTVTVIVMSAFQSRCYLDLQTKYSLCIRLWC